MDPIGRKGSEMSPGLQASPGPAYCTRIHSPARGLSQGLQVHEEPKWGMKCCLLVDISCNYNLNTAACGEPNAQGLWGWKGHLPSGNGLGLLTKEQLKTGRDLRDQSQGVNCHTPCLCLHYPCVPLSL